MSIETQKVFFLPIDADDDCHVGGTGEEDLLQGVQDLGVDVDPQGWWRRMFGRRSQSLRVELKGG